MAEAIIKALFSDRGFGFLERSDGKPDRFSHALACAGGMFTSLLRGDTVRFDEAAGRSSTGHASIETTHIYVKWNDQGLKKAVGEW